MALSVDELHTLGKLAYLEHPGADEHALAAEIATILDFANQLHNVDTGTVLPLFHPMHLHQRMRIDEVEGSEADCLQQLAEIAPQFDESYYLVPKVIDTEKHDV